MIRRIPKDAFEAYVGMGVERSYQALAERYGVSKRAIAKRAGVENWSERLERIEAEARNKSDQRILESLEQTRTRHLKTLKAVHSRALEALKNYPLTSGMEAVRAAELAIKLERLIVGEPSERTEMSVEEITRTEIQNLLVRKED